MCEYGEVEDGWAVRGMRRGDKEWCGMMEDEMNSESDLEIR